MENVLRSGPVRAVLQKERAWHDGQAWLSELEEDALVPSTSPPPLPADEGLAPHTSGLLLLRHAAACARPLGRCAFSPLCGVAGALWRHVLLCRDEDCARPHCRSTLGLLRHHRACSSPACIVCIQVRDTPPSPDGSEAEEAAPLMDRLALLEENSRLLAAGALPEAVAIWLEHNTHDHFDGSWCAADAASTAPV